MARLIIYAWFPHLAADRIRRTTPAPNVGKSGSGLILHTAKYHGADIVEAVCARARRRGLHTGMRLADARAICPELTSFDSNPAADAADLHQLALWARRYCPLTAPDDGNPISGQVAIGQSTMFRAGAKSGQKQGVNSARIAFAGDGIWLDVAGADHLYGGIRPLLADLARRLRKAGLTVRLGVAPTCGAAWALARYGRSARYVLAGPKSKAGSEKDASRKAIGAALAGLPLAALRIDDALCITMRTAGLRVIGDIINMPRAPLAARFGPQLIERLDAALGYVNESFAPIAPPRPLLTVQNFAEPVAAPDDIKAVIRRLTNDICLLLQSEGMAARRLRLGWKLLDGGVGVKDVHLSRPNRDNAAFHRLLADVSENINPEFGLEMAWMEAHGCSPQAPVAIGFHDGISPSESHADLVDRLVARLGYGAVLHMKSHASWQPEMAQYMALPDVEPQGFEIQGFEPQGFETRGGFEAEGGATNYLHSEMVPPRPIRLLAHPEPLSVIALLPDHPPAQFVWQKRIHKVSRASGPERIAPQWWVATKGTKTRDYFRLQDDQGARFWVYREGLVERGEDTKWFLHGFFA